MDAFRSKIREEVLSANRGPFGGWWEDLLEVDPDLLLKVHRLMLAAESGPLAKSFRHLIFVTVDSVVTHLYPRGIGVHARIAMDNGASLLQVVQALEIASIASNRGYSVVLQAVAEELAKSGPPRGSIQSAQDLRCRFESRVGEWQDWMDVAARHCPDALEALLDIGYGREAGSSLDPKQRALLMLAASASPALADETAARGHTRQALAQGASHDEVLQTVKMAGLIGLHPLVEGIPQVRALLSTNK